MMLSALATIAAGVQVAADSAEGPCDITGAALGSRFCKVPVGPEQGQPTVFSGAYIMTVMQCVLIIIHVAHMAGLWAFRTVWYLRKLSSDHKTSSPGAAGNPCVAAHSTTRALYAAYDGPLYKVTRSSDGKSARRAPGGRGRDRPARSNWCF